ncbi:LysR family transcriptional regulator [Shinella sp. PSBB067]|uniref:LysR family transcriptional regulator n=1 Tax=Shinella sp. PSBB067 TaxID=2715959 RepID=UPI00193BF374|nr:LysR family transcriptional regulator [Shinella sp. PSBB067]QRI65539.1 LysR family transcriptional regulator [Shinella sp. PSBB067]
MDLSTLCLVQGILEERGIRRAAARAERPASSASAALRRVEAALSVPLARREGQALVPTLEAEARLPHFTEIARAAAGLAALGGGGAAPAVSLAALARFAATARAGSINAAARSLGLGQPQLTRQLSHLEAAVGRALLDRSAKGISCTAAGLAALALAERIATAWDALSAASAERFRRSAATWRLGTVIPFGHESEIAAMLARLAVGWRAARPRQPLFLASTTADELVSGLKNRRFDLVLLDTDRYPAEFDGRLIGRSRLALAGPRTLGRSHDVAALLRQRPIAVPSPRSGLRQMTDRFLEATLPPAERARLTLVEVDSIPVIINLVLDHGHLSILPEHSVANIAPPPTLLPLDEAYQQSLSLVWPRDALSRQAADAMIALLSVP